MNCKCELERKRVEGKTKFCFASRVKGISFPISVPPWNIFYTAPNKVDTLKDLHLVDFATLLFLTHIFGSIGLRVWSTYVLYMCDSVNNQSVLCLQKFYHRSQLHNSIDGLVHENFFSFLSCSDLLPDLYLAIESETVRSTSSTYVRYINTNSLRTYSDCVFGLNLTTLQVISHASVLSLVLSCRDMLFDCLLHPRDGHRVWGVQQRRKHSCPILAQYPHDALYLRSIHMS